ncbi:type I-F CRISPR-associated protein Csy3 [Teredinibacter sp. KSP-S5-2]|uniref:type I-F CRISPR-associated protein Csy3 n=1 Tax=Teredinibacter sp. KSP-S5-2 TaxID=3034506 RepID=UPI002934F1BD|nr:type I-F CRISPR-associated protein Csy3 [Teredinibacter sp. KSP-S5-2]WNO08316.1 type I-F CRISPR-associated protein Csy3 [Teredinibacter sp. KSP-S5-2]
MAKLKTASVLAFERKLSNSDAIMFAGNWDERDKSEAWPGIEVQEKSVRGTISNRQKNAIQSDPAKLDQEVQKANLQTVDSASLPYDKNTLKLQFSLRVLGNVQQPSVCNDQEYQQVLESTIQGYIAEHQFSELSMRYAMNIASGRFLWRNRVGAEAVEVRVSEPSTEKNWKFDGYSFSLNSFTLSDVQKMQLTELAEVIEQGLKGNDFAFLSVVAFVKLGEGQEVFPSQELLLDSASSAKGRKSKTLYQVEQKAAMHSQKIGNALRTVDTWYPNTEKIVPISVEPFGSVTSRGKAYRQPKEKMDFYTLLDNWVLKGEQPPVEQQHYVIANLIRGGVYGEKAE